MFSGNTNLDTNAGGSGGSNLSVQVLNPGTLVNFDGSQHLAGLSIDAGASVAVRGAGNGVLETSNLAIAGVINNWQAALDLGANDLILHFPPGTGAASLARVTDQLRSGRLAGPSGYWDGPGIQSSAAASDPARATALGILWNDDGAGNPRVTVFDGVPVDVNTLLIKHTFYGDADLDGDVNRHDAALAARRYGGPGGWAEGDFSADGLVGLADVALIQRHLGANGAPSPDAIAPALSGLAPRGSTISRKPVRAVLSASRRQAARIDRAILAFIDDQPLLAQRAGF